MASSRFGIYVGPLSLNAGTPSLNQPINGNSVSTSAEVEAAIDEITSQLQGSGASYRFTDLFLWLFHFPDSNSPFFHSNPHTLTWNGTPMVPLTDSSGNLWELSPALPGKLQGLRNEGMNLLVSLGGWDGAGVFDTIEQIGIDTFVCYLETDVFGPYHMNGINIDLEASDSNGNWAHYYRKYGQTIVDLSNAVAAKGYVVTHTPANGLSTSFYVDSCPGLPGNQPILEATFQNGVQSIAYLNVQYYAGGDPYGASQGVASYNSLVSSLASIGPKTGISDAADFLMAGFSPCIADPQYPAGNEPLVGPAPGTRSCSSPTVVMDFLHQVARAHPAGYGGNFYWLYQLYNTSQDGYTNQVSAWNEMGSAI